MKYIRTKDGIERALYGEDFHEGKSYFYKTEYQWVYGDTYRKVRTKTYAKNGITKIADTIEELCDEFVLIHTEYDNSKDIFQNYSGEAKHRGDNYYNFNFEQIRTGKMEIDGTLFGAIWTDKGLIYVAKMNEKGELELI